jgi:hypothetical protein
VIYLGFDPGGLKGFGVALYDAASHSIDCATVSSVDEAVAWVTAEVSSAPVAAGIDTLLFWQSTPSGWRGADEFLRSRYPECRNSVVSANGLYGSMSVQGAVLAGRLRQAWPSIFLTETHPKVLWTALGLGRRYPRGLVDQRAAVEWSEYARVLKLNIVDDHQLDAALSAWAAERGHSGAWPRDLTQIPARHQRSENISVVSDVRYCWPE